MKYLGTILLLMDKLVLAAGPGSGVGQSAGAGSPFTTYTAGVAIYAFLSAVLVMGLLVGAFMVLSFGLLSKRPEDRVGKRTPSDIGILKSTNWPNAPVDELQLPAEEEEDDQVTIEVYSAPKVEEPRKPGPNRGQAA